MGLFGRKKEKSRTLPLSVSELDTVSKLFPADEIPIHLAFRSDIRISKQTKRDCIIGLSRHWIYCIDKKKNNFYVYSQVHISDVVLIASNSTEFVVVKTKTTNLTVTAPECLQFAQFLYRNHALSFSTLSLEDSCEVRATDLSCFPQIDIELSPSQRFQFTYFACCSLHQMKYNHEVVRYFHNLILSKNAIVDISQLPLDFVTRAAKSDLVPIFESFKLMKFVCGIACSNINRPEALKVFAPFLTTGDNIQIIHFEKCNIQEGLVELLDCVKANPILQVSYWNLSNNPLKNLSLLPEILTYSQNPVLYLNLSFCGVTNQISAALFSSLIANRNLWTISHLILAGIQLSSKEALAKFGEYLRIITTSPNVCYLETLDLSSMAVGFEAVMELILKHDVPLKRLYINNTTFTQTGVNQILSYIRSSQNLIELDVSSTNFNPEFLATLVSTISSNAAITEFSLHLNNLKLSTTGLLPLFRSFLSSNLSKWKCLTFDDNNMVLDDLRDLIPLFIRMSNLEEVSLSKNFSSSMIGIGETLPKLLKIPKINTIRITGGIKSKRLGAELFQFLEKVSTLPNIRIIDISNNDIGDSGVPYLSQILHLSPNLETFLVDGNGFRSIECLSSLVEAANTNTSIITMNFPVQDAQEIVKNAQGHDRDVSARRLGDLQISLLQRVIANRTRKHLPHDLPFAVPPEIQALIKGISRTAHSVFRGTNKKRHSYVTEFFGIPFPFQFSGDSVPYDECLEEIPGSLSEYYGGVPMNRYYNEKNLDFSTLCFTTMNPALHSLLNPQPVSKEPESFQMPNPIGNKDQFDEPEEEHGSDSPEVDDKIEEFILQTRRNSPIVSKPQPTDIDTIRDPTQLGIPPLRKKIIYSDESDSEEQKPQQNLAMSPMQAQHSIQEAKPSQIIANDIPSEASSLFLSYASNESQSRIKAPPPLPPKRKKSEASLMLSADEHSKPDVKVEEAKKPLPIPKPQEIKIPDPPASESSQIEIPSDDDFEWFQDRPKMYSPNDLLSFIDGQIGDNKSPQSKPPKSRIPAPKIRK